MWGYMGIMQGVYTVDIMRSMGLGVMVDTRVRHGAVYCSGFRVWGLGFRIFKV